MSLTRTSLLLIEAGSPESYADLIASGHPASLARRIVRTQTRGAKALARSRARSAAQTPAEKAKAARASSTRQELAAREAAGKRRASEKQTAGNPWLTSSVLARSGFAIVEADERLRKLERAASNGSHEAVTAYHQGLIRAGRSGEVMAHHVREHEKAKRAYDEARAPRPGGGMPRRWPEEITSKYENARRAIRNHNNEHGDHPADHVRRGKEETPRQLGDRLVDMTLATGTVRPGSGTSGHDHGTLSYESRHDTDKKGYVYHEKNKQRHYQHRDAMANAWKREVPEGHVSTGDRTYGDGTVKGSFVSFRTGPRPRGRR